MASNLSRDTLEELFTDIVWIDPIRPIYGTRLDIPIMCIQCCYGRRTLPRPGSAPR